MNHLDTVILLSVPVGLAFVALTCFSSQYIASLIFHSANKETKRSVRVRDIYISSSVAVVIFAGAVALVTRICGENKLFAWLAGRPLWALLLGSVLGIIATNLAFILLRFCLILIESIKTEKSAKP